MYNFIKKVACIVLTVGLTCASSTQEAQVVKECYDLPRSKLSGVYRLHLSPCSAIAAYCNLEADGGGWTVIQRRLAAFSHISFERSWEDYKWGFGTLDKEFWWGNENIWRLTNRRDRQYELRIVVETAAGVRASAKYDHFYLSSEGDKYKLHLGSYRGTAGDYLSYHNGQLFSTFDRDNDRYSSGSCAIKSKGGWWYKNCLKSNLNGPYRGPFTLLGRSQNATRVNWGTGPSLMAVEMMVRPFKTIAVQKN